MAHTFDPLNDLPTRTYHQVPTPANSHGLTGEEAAFTEVEHRLTVIGAGGEMLNEPSPPPMADQGQGQESPRRCVQDFTSYRIHRLVFPHAHRVVECDRLVSIVPGQEAVRVKVDIGLLIGEFVESHGRGLGEAKEVVDTDADAVAEGAGHGGQERGESGRRFSTEFKGEFPVEFDIVKEWFDVTVPAMETATDAQANLGKKRRAEGMEELDELRGRSGGQAGGRKAPRRSTRARSRRGRSAAEEKATGGVEDVVGQADVEESLFVTDEEAEGDI